MKAGSQPTLPFETGFAPLSGWDRVDRIDNRITTILCCVLVPLAALVSEPNWRLLFYTAAMVSLLFVSRWISERRSRLRELDVTHQRVDLAVESADLGLWEWRASDDSLWLSERCRVLLGITAEGDMHREFFLSHIHPDDRADFERRFLMLSREQPRFEMETRVVLPLTQELRWVSTRGRAHFDASGLMDQVFGASIDCTARRNAQAAAEQQRNHLAHLTRVATLGQLTGSLAHEITQPLTAILSNAQAASHHLASNAVDVAELSNIVEDIIADDRRASEIVNRLRAMVRKAAPQFALITALDVIRESIGLMHSELLQRGVTLTLNAAQDLPPVRADRVQFQQVLLNLLLNATDAVAKNIHSQRIIEVRAELEENSAIRITVTDHGAGFSSRQLAAAFEPFHSTKPQGLGIGLWISRVIMENHGGKILLANRPQGGAMVTILLPLSNERPTAPAHA